MANARTSWELLFVLSIAGLGCTTPVHIVQPTPGLHVDPVPQVEIAVDKYPLYSAVVLFDDQPLNTFSPPIASGVTSVAPLVFPQSAANVSHTIKVEATSGQFVPYPATPTVQFTPPQLIWEGGTASANPTLTPNSTNPLYIAVKNKPTVPIDVTIAETTQAGPIAQLGPTADKLSGPGTPVTITINPGSKEASFMIFIPADLAKSTNMTFAVTAPGTVPATGHAFAKVP